MQNYLRTYFSIAFLLCSAISFGQSNDSRDIDSLAKQFDSLMQQKEYEKSRDIAEQIIEIDSTGYSGLS